MRQGTTVEGLKEWFIGLFLEDRVAVFSPRQGICTHRYDQLHKQ